MQRWLAITLCCVAGLVGGAAGVGATLYFAERGPQGEQGEPGPRGSPGESAEDALSLADEALVAADDAAGQVADLADRLATVEDIVGTDRVFNEIDDLDLRVNQLDRDISICRALHTFC